MISYKKLFRIFILFLFLSFLVIYFAQANGYYETVNNEKKVLTDEKIKEFEEDVASGKKIDVDSYFVSEKKDYGNKVSNFGSFTSKLIGKYFAKGVNGLFSLMDDAMDN